MYISKQFFAHAPDFMPEKLDKIRLDHNSYISLHVQLHNQLRRLIVPGAGDLPPRKYIVPTQLRV